MRIGEEQDRRTREQQILSVLPGAIDGLMEQLQVCVEAYNSSFGADSARLDRSSDNLSITSLDKCVEVVTDPELPGFHIRREAVSMAVRIGVLPNGKLFYFDVAGDQYLSMEELTRRILDRVLFPKLREL